ncbi:hypothetical protein AQPW35_00210 [Rubrivivax pictus]|uniref:Uncharacterized protein n=1 Tax=Pseudaquabacterium pictum TaxID=2315236 RepID=A0A480AJR6_9BURK|nr:hypothetical protein AQPW35_00210 [Rubrivivax pictus]
MIPGPLHPPHRTMDATRFPFCPAGEDGSPGKFGRPLPDGDTP